MRTNRRDGIPVVEIHEDGCTCGCAELPFDDITLDDVLYSASLDETLVFVTQEVKAMGKKGQVVKDVARSMVGTQLLVLKNISVKGAGIRVGALASHVAKPFVSFADGVREGWKNGS